MGENNLRRQLRAAAVVSLAILAASCGGNRHEAPVMNGLNGAAPDRIEAAPVSPMAPIPRSSRPQTAAPSGPGQRVVVRPGQSVGYLAREYGVTKRAIIEANNLTPPEYKIEIGKTLVIPGAAPVEARHARPCAPLRRKNRPRRLRSAPPLLPEPRKRAKSSRSTSPRRRQGNRQRRRRSAFRRRSASAKGKLSPPAAEAERAARREDRRSRRRRTSRRVEAGTFHGRCAVAFSPATARQRRAARTPGINIAASRGTPVRTVDSGTVAYAGNEIRGYGNLVLVKHSSGLISAYAHLDALLVKRGDTVSRGQVIAKVGDTGGVSQPQLHFELRRGKKAVDPREFLGQGSNAGGSKGAQG